MGKPTAPFGISGGSAAKFGLYRNPEGNYFINAGDSKKQLSPEE